MAVPTKPVSPSKIEQRALANAAESRRAQSYMDTYDSRGKPGPMWATWYFAQWVLWI